MRNQATRNDVIAAQRKARQQRIESLFVVPLGLLIVVTYTYLALPFVD